MKLGVAVVAATVSASGALGSPVEDIFIHPERYVGQRVTVCGYIHDRFEDQNIWPSE